MKKIIVLFTCFLFLSAIELDAQSFSGTYISNPKFNGEDQIVIVHKKSNKQLDDKLKIKGIKNKRKIFDYQAGEGKPKDFENLIAKYVKGKEVISVFFASDSFQEKEYTQYAFISYKISEDKFGFIVIKEIAENFDSYPHTTKSFKWEMSSE